MTLWYQQVYIFRTISGQFNRHCVKVCCITFNRSFVTNCSCEGNMGNVCVSSSTGLIMRHKYLYHACTYACGEISKYLNNVVSVCQPVLCYL